MISEKITDHQNHHPLVIVCYQLNEQDMVGIQQAYSSRYRILDCSDCIEDVIAIPAAMVFINPQRLNKEQWNLIDQYFRYETETSFIFTEEPKEMLSFSFYVDTNLKSPHISWMNGYDQEAIEDAYQKVLKKKEEFLETIRQRICEESKYESLTSRIAITEKNCILYDYINEILNHIDQIDPKEKVSYRKKVRKELDGVLQNNGIDVNRILGNAKEREV